MRNEHGIAVVEAMAAGCLPVVSASGGPLEIVANGLYGLIYKNRAEIPELLNRHLIFKLKLEGQCSLILNIFKRNF